MKKFILVTMIAAAAMFSACGDDDDNGTSAGGSDFGGSSDSKASSSEVVVPTSSGGSGSTVSCDVYMGDAGDISGHVCFEYADAEVVKQQCAVQNSQYSAIGGSATSGSGCPSGAKLECPQAGGMIYIYGVLAYGSSCSDFIVKD